MRRIVKPKYVDPIVFGGGEQITFRPPLLFREVTARAFPLKANIARLAEFVDQYLNMDIPDEIVHFTPALPYVYFMALNYGGMSATTLDAQRLGWVAQHEAFFLIPLQRWRREHGKLKFQGWTSVTPFIFVDDPFSMATGREVYGWPKNLAWIEADRPVWTTHPRAPTRQYRMDVDMFREVYAGQQEPPRTLVTIDRDVTASYAEYPLNYKCPWSITSVVPNMYATSMSLMEEAADILAHLRLRGFPDYRSSSAIIEMARESLALCQDMMAGLSPFPMPQFFGEPLSGTNARAPHVEDLPRYFSSTINLKQFRASDNVDLACYSALVESAMGVDRLNQFGLLGDWDLLRGDKSAGYSISISRYRAQPIIETLGIEVPPRFETAQEGDVVTLRPSFPFWMDMDLYYGAGDVICSRTADLGNGEWIEETKATGAAGPQRQGRAHERTPRHRAHRNAYNTALGAATLPITGPLHFPDLTTQVYPLLADRAILKQFLDFYWNSLFEGERKPPDLELELLGSYVYLTISVVGDEYGKMWSETQNIGWWAEREATFAIPVLWRSEGKLVGMAWIEPLVFADKPRAVATDREVNGRNSFKAVIESPPDVWTSPGGPGRPRRLARVATESFVELGFGLNADTQTLLEIDQRPPLPEQDVAGWARVADSWGRRYADELHRKSRAWREGSAAITATQAMALEVLARGAPLHRLTLKQYRDAADFDRACYQAVVHNQRRIGRIHEIGEIEGPPHVALHRLANYPIVQTLGLRVKHTESGASVVDYLEPVRPFWIRAAVTEDLGRVIATVDPHFAPDTGGEPPRRWKPNPPPRPEAPSRRTPRSAAPPDYFDGDGATPIGGRFGERLREGERRDLKDKTLTLSRRTLMKELHALRRELVTSPSPVAGLSGAWLDAARAPDPETFTAFLEAQTSEQLYQGADALAAGLSAWRPPAPRRARVVELRRLSAQALRLEQLGAPERAAVFARIEDAAMRKRCEALLRVFADPDRETNADLRAVDARGLYETYVALERALSASPAPSEPAEPSGESAPPPVAAAELPGLLKRVEAWIVKPAGFKGDWRWLVSEAASAALQRLRAARFVCEYDFEPERMALLEATFGGWEPLRALAKAAGEGAFHDAQRRCDAARARGETPALDPTAALAFVADALTGDVADWAEPSRWQRMKRAEARQAVEALEDLQLVFEAILDDRWEQGKPPYDGVRARIPAACVGPLGATDELWAAKRGLRRANDGADFVVAGDLPP